VLTDNHSLPVPEIPDRAHQPVLYQQIIHALQPNRGGFYLDGTVGAGGHAWGILEKSSPDGQLLGLDRDPQALELARRRLEPYGRRVHLRHASYAALSQLLAELDWPPLQGILLDLGLSSMQLDTPERGFSFRADAPLDMRFDPSAPLTAADLVNDLSEAELVDLLHRYGEEPQARRIAAAIVRSRPLETTLQLANVIAAAVPPRRRSTAGKGAPRRAPAGSPSPHLHPATLTFQALRIAVNGELQALELALPQALDALAPGGRMAVISFHSLEDRLVKQFFRRESQGCLCPPRQPICTCGHQPALRELTRRPIQPDQAECAENPRARSARLRLAERL
jgi:16S rRNA (cytosine1402-N4)-methyltransferase